MAPEPNRLRLRFAAREENVAIVRALVAAAAAALPFTLPEVEELRIAASEAVSNAVLHAYDTDVPGEVEMALEIGGDAIVVVVRDWGRGIEDVADARRPEVSTLDGHLGLGFAFMEAMSDELSVVSRSGEGTTVSIVKRVHAQDRAAGSRPTS